MDQPANHRDGRAKAGEPRAVGNLLTSALNMEDQISRGVYDEYLDRANWPAQLDDDTFEQIRTRLTTLVEDTKKHARILQALIKEHAKAK